MFERVFPPMEFKESSLRVAQHLNRIYAEIGGTLNIRQVARGGASDAAFASLRTRAPP
jgi:glutamate carboxypeptidase